MRKTDNERSGNSRHYGALSVILLYMIKIVFLNSVRQVRREGGHYTEKNMRSTTLTFVNSFELYLYDVRYS